jgi:hypothetical protein
MNFIDDKANWNQDPPSKTYDNLLMNIHYQMDTYKWNQITSIYTCIYKYKYIYTNLHIQTIRPIGIKTHHLKFMFICMYVYLFINIYICIHMYTLCIFICIFININYKNILDDKANWNQDPPSKTYDKTVGIYAEIVSGLDFKGSNVFVNYQIHVPKGWDLRTGYHSILSYF